MATTTDFFKVIFGAEDELSGPMASIAGGAAKLLLSFVAVQKIGDFLSSSVKSALESEVAWNKLGNAVEKHGGIWREVEGSFQSFASALQNQTGISDEAIAESLQLFIDYGASGSQAMERVRAAADLAAGASIDLGTATNLLAKASSGATELLGRYGIRVDENIPKSERLAAALDLIGERFGGRAAENAKTLTGRIQILSEKYDDLKESIGGVVVGPLTELVDNLNDQLTVWQSKEVSLWEKIFSGADRYAEIANRIRITELGMLAAHTKFGEVPPGKPPVDPEELERAKKAQEELNKLIQENRRFNFEQMGQSGFEVVDQRIKAQQEFMDAFRDKQDESDMDRLSSIFDYARESWAETSKIQIEESEKLLDAARDHQEEWQQMALSSTGQLTSEIAGMFVGLEGDLKSVFRNIAKDWIALVLNEILKTTALRVGAQLFNLFFPGAGSIAGAAAGAAAGKVTGAGVTGASAGYQVNIYGDVIGDEEYVAKRLVPILERGAEFGANRIALSSQGAT